jgi:hypothetical protein
MAAPPAGKADNLKLTEEIARASQEAQEEPETSRRRKGAMLGDDERRRLGQAAAITAAGLQLKVREDRAPTRWRPVSSRMPSEDAPI